MRRRPDTKYVDPSRQIRVRREDRVRLVSMPSSPAASEKDRSE